MDLAWGDKNHSGFCVIDECLNILEISLVLETDTIIKKILSYKDKHSVFLGVDAPLKVTNETGNRDIEKSFIKDFAKHKISMLPVNRTLLLKMFKTIKGEDIQNELTYNGFSFNPNSEYFMSEVYPHSSLAVLFNNYKIIPYKRKKGRLVKDIKNALDIYKNYMFETLNHHIFFDQEISELQGQSLKDYEDKIDALTSAYTMYFFNLNPQRCKIYKSKNEAIFITPIL